MTTISSMPDQDLSADTDALPCPDTTALTASGSGVNMLPRPLPRVTDTGRIKFGAACRLPVQK